MPEELAFHGQVDGWRESRQGSMSAPMFEDVPLYVQGDLAVRSIPDANAGFMIAGQDVIQATIRPVGEQNFPPWANADLLTESGDRPWTARLRRHQSWYREQVLGVPPGIVDGRPPVASRLPEWAVAQDATLNFLVNDQIHASALKRLRARGEGGIVEPHRLFHNLLSSQPLCFNLFGMLRSHRDVLALGLSKLLDYGIADILDLRIEHRPHVPGYRSGSAFDCYIEYRTTHGDRGFLGIETKYSEDLHRQFLSTNPVYEDAMRARPGIFQPEALGAVRRPATSQLIYNCILAIKLREQADRGFDPALGRCLVLACEDDLEARDAAQEIRAGLSDPDDLLISCSYEHFLDALPFSDDLEAWKDHFRLRYLNLASSA